MMPDDRCNDLFESIEDERGGYCWEHEDEYNYCPCDTSGNPTYDEMNSWVGGVA